MKRLLALSALAFLVPACGMHPRSADGPPGASPPGAPALAPAPEPAATPLPNATPSAPAAPAPESRFLPAGSIADNLFVSGAAALEDGRPGRALDLFAEAWKEVPGHPGVGRNFAAALERLKKQGDEAEQTEKPEQAGKAWATALSYLSHPAAKGKPLPFTRSDLKESLERLSKTLMDKGLVEYREGRFESAIGWWQKILAYDPANEEAAKSVRTATTQLETLRKINPKK